MTDVIRSVTDHTIAPTDAPSYTSPDTGAVLKAIHNPFPRMLTEQEHTIELPELCPASRNPSPGSSLRIGYRSSQRFLEVFSLNTYIQAFVGHKLVRDVEQLTQSIARDCTLLLQEEVWVEGNFVLQGIQQRVRTRAQCTVATAQHYQATAAQQDVSV